MFLAAIRPFACRAAACYSTKASLLPSTKITGNLEKRLTQLVERHDSLLSKLNDTSLASKELTNVSKELAGLSAVKSLYVDWEKNASDLAQLGDLLAATQQPDEELLELAKEEYGEIIERLGGIERDLIKELVPKDAADEASAILEIRAGAGGDEAALFTSDMARMYERFSQLQRWKWEVLAKSEDPGLKGYKDIMVNISGKDVFGILKYESGVHRVQRVPATESQGRIHTSTVTVAILPQPTEVDVQIRDSDLRIDVYRASGAGGQHVNTTDSAVRITHIPTGLVVAMQDERSQHKNKAKALKVLRAKVYEMEREKTDRARRDSRNKQIGSGDRSEKIRTYNYPQNRVTDHRINLTLYELEPIMAGEGLMRVIEPLREHHLYESISFTPVLSAKHNFQPSNLPTTPTISLDNDPRNYPEDEGFASSSSLEADSTAEIVRRKRAQKQSKRGIPPTPIQPAMAPEKPYYDNLVTAAPLERILWLASFGWAVYKADDLIFSRGVLSCWIGLLLLGAAAPYAIHGLYNPSTTDPKLKLDRVSSGTSSEDFIPGSDLPASPSLKQASRKQRHQHPLNRMVGVGLFGASRNSLRGDADDGILCGTLLLPMVGIAKITDIAKTEMDQAHFARVHAVLELTFLTAFLFLVLIAANALLQPLRRSLRKRSFFFLSLMVSALFTFVMTQILPLTPFLREVPNIVTMGAVLAFQWSLYICVVALKRSFTLGEMCVLSQAIAVLVFGSLCMILRREMPEYFNMSAVDAVTVLLYGLILGIIMIGGLTYPQLRRSRHLAQKPYWRSSHSGPTLSTIQNKRIIIALMVYALTATTILFIISPVCKRSMGEDPFIWTLSFVFTSPSRLLLCVYWTLTIAATVIIWVLVLDFSSADAQQQSVFNEVQGKELTSTLNKKRKVFHILSVVMFVPGVLLELPFLQLAFGVALVVFIYLEYLRYFAIWPYGKNIHMFLTEFIDNRDLGPVILSHIYLLLGCAGPVWIESSHLLATMSGILALGFGDTAASIVGKRYGRIRWPGTKKTVEGTVAFVISVFASAMVIMYGAAFLLGIKDGAQFVASSSLGSWVSILSAITLTGLLEALSSQNDNIIIPLYIYSMILLINQ